MTELHDQDRVPDEDLPDWHQEDKDDRPPQLLWEARYVARLSTRREYAATLRRYSRDVPAPGNHVMCSTAELAFEVAGREAGTVWVRDVAELPWVVVHVEAPF